MKTYIILFVALACIVTVATVSAQETGSSNAKSMNPTVIAARFVKQIAILSKVDINDEIFNSEVFNSLVDSSRPIPEEASGRPNPFAPLP